MTQCQITELPCYASLMLDFFSFLVCQTSIFPSLTRTTFPIRAALVLKIDKHKYLTQQSRNTALLLARDDKVNQTITSVTAVLMEEARVQRNESWLFLFP